MIAIDIGCAYYGGDAYSIPRLIERFHPERVIGYDPNVTAATYQEDTTTVEVRRAAVSSWNGRGRYVNPGSGGRVVRSVNGDVIVVDIADIVRDLDGAVLKIDAEGDEYRILQRLINTGLDKNLSLAWVEWHGDQKDRPRLEAALACPVEPWTW